MFTNAPAARFYVFIWVGAGPVAQLLHSVTQQRGIGLDWKRRCLILQLGVKGLSKDKG